MTERKAESDHMGRPEGNEHESAMTGSAGYYEKSMDSLQVPQAEITVQQQETSGGQGSAASAQALQAQWGDFDD